MYTELADDCFGDLKPVVVCKKGSNAETFAEQHELSCIFIE